MSEKLTARAEAVEGLFLLRPPTVGLWRDAPAKGSLVTPGAPIGAIEVLGQALPLFAPHDAAGIVTEVFDASRARSPVDYATVLLRLDPEGAGEAVAATAAGADAAEGGVVFASPMSGRFYAKPSPDQPPFLKVGDVIEEGQAVCLLEVMKTFNRVSYGGPGLPARAKVAAIVPADGDDIDEGAPILRLEDA
jgi:acetyl-CoA carboxylase biotin carboxyl carrier protein